MAGLYAAPAEGAGTPDAARRAPGGGAGRVRARGASPRVEVRETRHGRELLVDDTFASFYRPGRETTGPVWDAIAASLLALPAARRRRVLLLGLGGGSAARTLRALAPDCEIVGVERDADVLRAARREFGLDALGVEAVLDDARRFVRRERRRFDLVIDDVFVGRGDAVCKPDWLPEPGLDHALRRLRPEGVLASNTLDEAPEVAAFLRERRPALVAVDVREYDNRILVAAPAGLTGRRLRRAVAASPVLRGTLPHLRFRTLA